ncbi:MAG: shikimate kinase [Parvularculaceae bacterium]|nr:shikimate kinase [Parvularculaceae bacterium]
MPRPKPDASPQIHRTIALIGMMGAGKTTIGRRLARALNMPFKDADAEIERAAGMAVGELFERHGEESFRKGEAQVIERLLSGPPIVLATGGGAITHPQTRRLLKERALTVWLRADLDTLARRATRRPTRPLLQTDDPRSVIEKLLKDREPFYSAADIVIESQPGPHSRTVDEVLAQIRLHTEKEPPP